MDYSVYIEILKTRLDDYRLNHSLCVAKEAKRLAEKYGADAEKAYLAGLLHDITKNESCEFHLNYFKEFDIILTDVEKQSDRLWHAMSAALFVRNELKIDDEALVSAIRYHTTAKSNMTLLEKIIFVADFISIDRNYPDVDVMRQLADVSLDRAAVYALSYTIKKLISNKQLVHPDATEAYNDCLQKINKSEATF